MCLYRIVELSAGRITIDGRDIAHVPLRVLRARLSIIPQDPVLFTGSLRHNLDPFDERSDAQLRTALERCALALPNPNPSPSLSPNLNPNPSPNTSTNPAHRARAVRPSPSLRPNPNTSTNPSPNPNPSPSPSPNPNPNPDQVSHRPQLIDASNLLVGTYLLGGASSSVVAAF